MIYPEFVVPGKNKIAVTAPSDGNSKEFDYRHLVALYLELFLGIKWYV